MQFSNFLVSTILFLVSMLGCRNQPGVPGEEEKVRPLKDTVGFAQYPWQMDSIMSRVEKTGWKSNPGTAWKLAVCPHDDYTYVGSLYPELLQNIKAPTLFLIGVAHKAAQLLQQAVTG